MKDELEQQLFNDFPNVFRNHSYLSVGDGWYDIIRELAQKLEPLAKEWWKDKDPNPPVPEGRRYVYKPSFVVQVKEKFGGLRFYTNYHTDEIRDAVALAESKSFKTCEVCGKPGESRSGGWIKVLCDEHAENN